MTKVYPKPHVDVRYRVATHGDQHPERFVIHCWQSTGTIEGVAAFWERQGRGLGSQYMMETNGRLGQGAEASQLCYHVENHNTGSIGLELEGFADWSKARWLLHQRMLHRAAKLIAHECTKHSIPLKHSTIRGVCMHRDFHGSHTDPGANFPFYYVLRLAQGYAKLAR